MKRFILIALLLSMRTVFAEVVNMETADCTKMKTYKLREECLAAQGKTEEDLSNKNRTKKSGVAKFKTVKSLFEHIKSFEFSVANNKEPIDIALFPYGVRNPSLPEREEVKRAILEGVYRTFVHTDVKCIDLSIIPMFVENGRQEYSYKREEKLHVCRDKALQVLRNVTGITSFDDMVVKQVNDWGANDWNNSFVNIYYGETKTGDNKKRDDMVNSLKKQNPQN